MAAAAAVAAPQSMAQLYPHLGVDAAATAKLDRHPWRRYWAKMVDLVLVAMPLFMGVIFVLTLVAPAVSAGILKALDNQIFAGIMLLLVYILADTVLLSTFGTTPARAIFGIRLSLAGGGKLSFMQAFQRSAMVSFFGMGLGIGIVAIFTQYFSYKRLNETGKTRWDEELGCEVRHTEWGVGRAALAIAATVVAILVTVALTAAGRAPR